MIGELYDGEFENFTRDEERVKEMAETLNMIPMSVIEDIKAEIKDLHNSHMIQFIDADGAVDTCLNIIDRHIGAKEQEK